MLNNYNDQSKANIQCFLEDTEYSERREALFKLIDEFEKEGVRWSVICSSNLFLRGIVDEFHDLDFLIDESDIDKVIEIMERNKAVLIETGGNGYCESDVYMHYQLGRVDVDILAGFRVNTYSTSYRYKFNKKELDFIEVDKTKIKLVSMEAQYILYSMMEGWQAKRRFKRILIEDYLLRKNSDLKYAHILRDNGGLPAWIKRNIRALLNY